MKDRIDAILQRRQAEYLDSLQSPRDALLERMEECAREEGHPIADPEVAQLLRILVRIRRPRRLLEVGTNIGYSVVVMGRECGEGSVVETIEIDRSILAKAKQFVAGADLRCRVVFHEGAALDVIPALEGTFDFVFIDCVKTEYEQYLDGLLPKLEPGAVIVCDNLLWKGLVAEGSREPSPAALRRFNERLMTDPRLTSIVLPLGDGTGVSVVR
ncbi:MAG TPA: O-methyltransferase [Thermoanaerobaculia bacterium]|nr:O-methyltransferase [Thermoanaerobaculia bacterium]